MKSIQIYRPREAIMIMSPLIVYVGDSYVVASKIIDKSALNMLMSWVYGGQEPRRTVDDWLSLWPDEEQHYSSQQAMVHDATVAHIECLKICAYIFQCSLLLESFKSSFARQFTRLRLPQNYPNMAYTFRSTHTAFVLRRIEEGFEIPVMLSRRTNLDSMLGLWNVLLGR